MKIVKFSIIAILIATIGFLIYKVATKKDDTDKKVEIVAKKRDIREDVFVPGNVRPKKEIEIKPQLSGVIDQLFVKIGDNILSGTPIASIKLVPSALELERLESNLKISKISFDAAKIAYDRAVQLFSTKTISQSEMDDAQKNYDSARAQLEAARNQLEIQKKGKISSSAQISNIVKSSIAGTIIDLPLLEGASVVERNSMNPGTTVAIMAQMGEFIFESKLSEQYLQYIKLGDTISLNFNAYKDFKTKAIITKISAKGELINEVMRYTIEANFPVTPSMPTIRSGYTATAEIVLVDRKNVLSLEEKYINYVKDSIYVFVDNKGKKEKKIVKLGASDGQFVEILGGITEKDKIQKDDTVK